MGELRFMQGSEMVTEGAIAAGARFYAGYPITPSTEVAKTSSIRLPQVDGVYIQMENEINSMAALIGVSCSEKESYTATSGPGLSLTQKNLGATMLGKIPCVIIDVQRSGPSIGLATKPTQGDILQACWGTHGDHSMIVPSSSSVQDCFDLMITTFNYSKQYRVPVIFLSDEVIGHLREQVIIRSPEEVKVVEWRHPGCPPQMYKPYDHIKGLAPLAAYGDKYIFKVNGGIHDGMGYPCARPGNADRMIRHLSDKIESHRDEITITHKYTMEDAQYVIIAYDDSAHSAFEAMKKGRNQGIPVDILQLVTIWPMAEKGIREAMEQAEVVVVPELNLGQYIGEIRMRNPKHISMEGVNRVDRGPIEPANILKKVEEATK